MNDLLRLRRGERLNPAEFSDGILQNMHRKLDAIAAEQSRDARRELLLRVLSWVMNILAVAAIVVMVGLCVAEGLGWL